MLLLCDEKFNAIFFLYINELNYVIYYIIFTDSINTERYGEAKEVYWQHEQQDDKH